MYIIRMQNKKKVVFREETEKNISCFREKVEKRTKLKKICWKNGQNDRIFRCIIGQKAVSYTHLDVYKRQGCVVGSDTFWKRQLDISGSGNRHGSNSGADWI